MALEAAFGNQDTPPNPGNQPDPGTTNQFTLPDVTVTDTPPSPSSTMSPFSGPSPQAPEPGGTQEANRQQDLAWLNNRVYELESNRGRDTSTSRTGARGPMQVEPGTFKENAPPGANIDNVQDNMNAGSKYIEKLYDHFHGDLDATLAGYNAGPGRVGTGKPLPQETIDYINKAHASVPAPPHEAYQGPGAAAVSGTPNDYAAMQKQLQAEKTTYT